jgi:hypothetical protein
MRILVFLMIYCWGSGRVSAQSEADKNEILSILNRQETDWNRGDIASFMVGYWESDSLSFTGSGGITYGYRSVYENYRKRYPDRSHMGTLKFEVREFHFLAPGVVQLIGRYHLIRETTGEAEGYFTLIWRKIGSKWVITSDHTSG